MRGATTVLAAALLAFSAPAPVRTQEDSRIKELIGRLTDDNIAARDQAAAELADLGTSAIRELERLKKSGDLELRARAAAILKKIAENEVVGRHWRRGAKITLDAEQVPASKVLEELARKAGDTFKVSAADFADPISVHVKDAPFWEALDAICRASSALTWDGDGDQLAFSRKRRPPYPAVRQGEFQVWLDGITFTRDFDFTPNTRSTFVIVLASAWESGISPIAVDQRLTEVLDEDGANLLAPDRFGFPGRLDAPKGRMRKDGIYAPFAVGAKIPRRFSKVKGYANFLFPKGYEEVSFDVNAASPAPVTVDRLTLGMRNFRAQKNAYSFEVTVTTALGPAGDPMLDRLPMREISLVDDQGTRHKSPSSSRGQSYGGATFTTTEHLQVTLPEGRTPVSVHLRLLKEVLEKRVVFEFADIPLE